MIARAGLRSSATGGLVLAMVTLAGCVNPFEESASMTSGSGPPG